MTRTWTGNTLKIIAIVTMLTDHIGASLIENGLLHQYDPVYLEHFLTQARGMNWWIADMVLRCIGRAAFPLFAFLLVEGFLHTRDLKKYIVICFLFALISEIPFNLAFGSAKGEGGVWADQNIYFTLTLGLVMMAALKRYGDRRYKQAVIILAAAAAARLLRTDYEEMGIFIIAVFYLLRSDRYLMYLTAGALLFAESYSLFGSAALALIPISRYSGERGGGRFFKGRKKYLFYWFYPVHLIVLYLIGHAFLGM